MWLWLADLALATSVSPMVVVDWSGSDARLQVWAPLGVELNAEAPAVVDLTWADRSVHWESTGAVLERGMPFTDARAARIEGTVELSLCDKAAGTCVQQQLAVSGSTGDRKRGQAILAVSTAVAPAAKHGPEYQTDAQAIADAAFAAARADGKRVLLDFGAVWCPPCNMMAAEVLHVDPAPEALDAYHVAVLDADDPRSFALKDRYKIGGYPTVVITNADGTEISRQVGYPGVEDMIAWLDKAAAQEGPDADPTTIDPATVTPERAAEIALELLSGGAKDVAPWLERASAVPDSKDFRMARLASAPTLEDATWLRDNAPGTAARWVYGALELAKEDAGRAVIRDALQRDLGSASGTDAADLLYLLAETAAEADQPLFYAASASALRSALTGDPERDRAHYTWLAVLIERAGDVDGALKFLDDAIARWPDEPTFHLSRSALLLRAERTEEALAAARRGLDASWGDNKLRMVQAQCKALVALDRKEEAATAAAGVLAEIPPPPEGLEVRTWNYRKALQAFVDGA